LLTFGNVQNPLRLPRKTLQRPKLVGACGAFTIFDFDMVRQYSTCALRHSGVHFFNIPTFKRAPTLRRFLMLFAHFDFEIFCAPPWRALFQQLNFQKLRPSVFSMFSLRHVFRATTACIFVNISISKSALNLTGFSQF